MRLRCWLPWTYWLDERRTMADTPQTQKKEPAPRPPRQPDPKLITYLERGKDEAYESAERDPKTER